MGQGTCSGGEFVQQEMSWTGLNWTELNSTQLNWRPLYFPNAPVCKYLYHKMRQINKF